MRRKPEPHLTLDGIHLANRVGRTLGDFDQVITSNLPRAYETAVAMGYEITSSFDELGVISQTVTAAVRWPGQIERIRTDALQNPYAKSYGDEQARRLRNLATNPIGRQTHTLLISHGIIMELALLASTGWMEISNSEEVFGYCEGYVLKYIGAECILCDIKRLPGDLRIVDTNYALSGD